MEFSPRAGVLLFLVGLLRCSGTALGGLTFIDPPAGFKSDGSSMCVIWKNWLKPIEPFNATFVSFANRTKVELQGLCDADGSAAAHRYSRGRQHQQPIACFEPLPQQHGCR
jgi:hypothetical protein